MTMPTDVKAIDLMLQIPGEDTTGWYDFMKPLLLDEESRQLIERFAQINDYNPREG